MPLIYLIENHGATEFYVGSNDNFDSMVRRQLENLSQIYPTTCIVLAYFHVGKNVYYDHINTILPEDIKTIFKRFAISYRNNWIIQQTDVVVTYVVHTYEGAWQFKAMAEKQRKVAIKLSE